MITDLPLPVQNPAALIQTTGAQHGSVHIQHQIGGQANEGRSRRIDGSHDHVILPWVVGCEQSVSNAGQALDTLIHREYTAH